MGGLYTFARPRDRRAPEGFGPQLPSSLAPWLHAPRRPPGNGSSRTASGAGSPIGPEASRRRTLRADGDRSGRRGVLPRCRLRRRRRRASRPRSGSRRERSPARRAAATPGRSRLAPGWQRRPRPAPAAARARGLSLLAMELVPRITRAQTMDVLSSQATVAGYQAVLLGASHLARLLPMLTTAAGTIPPGRVLVLGAGVAEW